MKFIFLLNYNNPGLNYYDVLYNIEFLNSDNSLDETKSAY